MTNYPDYQETIKKYQEYFELAEKFADLYASYIGEKSVGEAKELHETTFSITWEEWVSYGAHWDDYITGIPAELLFADEAEQRQWIETYLAEQKAKEKAAKEEKARQDKARRLAKAKAIIAELEGALE